MAHALMLACANVHTPSPKYITVVLISLARIHLELAHAARPARATSALERIDHVGARASVHARRRLALVRIDLAVVAAVTRWTHTTVGKGMVKAGATVQAGCRGALVQFREACPDGYIRISSGAGASI